MRTFLDGRFENSAFCLLAPNGQDWLSRSGRGPEMVLGRQSATLALQAVAAKYKATADLREALVPDFHSTRQALNVASADQRVLVLVHGSDTEIRPLRKSLQEVASDAAVIGRFHFDFESADQWQQLVPGSLGSSGIHLIRPGEFGLGGNVLDTLPLDAPNSEIHAALRQANHRFAQSTRKKVYSSHVRKGERLGIYFEGAVPYGEDRNGDGEIDFRGGRRAPNEGVNRRPRP